MWEAKALLLEGLKWRVGNGTSIKVWEDSWIPGDWTHIVPSPTTATNLDMRVCELLDFDNGCWNVDAVNATFIEDERQQVLDIPIPLKWRNDSRFWCPSLDGAYTVKSGYWLGRMGHTQTWNLYFGVAERDL